jgi:hypothetical protein
MNFRVVNVASFVMELQKQNQRTAYPSDVR